jgi:hypothetical protein
VGFISRPGTGLFNLSIRYLTALLGLATICRARGCDIGLSLSSFVTFLGPQGCLRLFLFYESILYLQNLQFYQTFGLLR